MADARIRGRERAAFTGDAHDIARALQGHYRSLPWDPITFGCVTCRGYGDFSEFDGDLRKCPTCGGTGDAPGKPGRLRLAAFMGYEPARLILPKKKMPSKTGIEDHDIKSGFRLLNYTFGILPVYAGLLEIARRRLIWERNAANALVSRIQLLAVGEAAVALAALVEWHKNPLEMERREHPQILPSTHSGSSPWWFDLARITWLYRGEDHDDEEIVVTGGWRILAGRLATISSGMPPANETLDRLSRIMVSLYPALVGELKDYECWKAFKLTVIKWALGPAY